MPPNINLYSPFGEISTLSGTTFGFTGQRYDSELGLYYFKHRYYSPKLGRFLQPDPIGYSDGLNLYSYANNDAINQKDSLGLASSGNDNAWGNHQWSGNESWGNNQWAGTAGMIRIPKFGPLTKLPNNQELQWPEKGNIYKDGNRTYTLRWQPGDVLINPQDVTDWVHALRTTNPSNFVDDTENATRHILYGAIMTKQLAAGGSVTGFAIDATSILFEGTSFVLRGFKGDARQDLINTSVGVNIGLSQALSSAQNIANTAINVGISAGGNGGVAPGGSLTGLGGSSCNAVVLEVI